MGLESASYISQLVSSNPPESDPAEQAADHLRLIKTVLQNTFPNVTGPVVASQGQINSVATGVVPPGAISLWYGTLASIPAGWGLCNGSTYALLSGSGNITSPNLNQLFVLGAGSTFAPGTTGGLAYYTPTLTDPGTVLTQANLPNCSMTVTDPGHSHTVTDPGHSHSTAFGANSGGGYYAGGQAAASNSGRTTNSAATGISLSTDPTGISVSTGGSGTAHVHNIASSPVLTIPPFMALAYIIKL